MTVVKTLGVIDVAKIADKVNYRRTVFGEDLTMALGVVLMNYGDEYVRVQCAVGCGWTGSKAELTPREGIPLGDCGHPLFEVSEAPRLALVQED